MGLSAVGASVGDELVTPANASFTGAATIGGDAVIGGNLSSVGTVTIGGTLELGGAANVVGVQLANRAPYQSPGTTPPCDCDPSTFFDVGAAVAAAKAAAGGSSNFSNVGTQAIHLSSGNYYVTASDTVGTSAIVIDGIVSVFVDGSLAQVGAQGWLIAPGGQLDLFVSGNVGSVGSLVAGDPSAPSAFRLYIGGTQDTSLGTVGTSAFFGAIYAPESNIKYVGSTLVVGAIFAKTIEGVGTLTIEYGDQSQPPSSCGTGTGSGSTGNGSNGGNGGGSNGGNGGNGNGSGIIL
jgi:hypothetical protein